MTGILAWLLPRMLLVAGSLALFLGLGEAYFRFVHDESDGFGVTLAARRWHKRHYKPINSYGIRDIEWDFSTDKPKVFILGDSFLEGAGIKRIEDRLSGILRRKHPELAIYNVAQGAWDTVEEFKFLTKLRAVPETLIYGYYMNDIALIYRPILPKLRVESRLVKRSALANYLYWQLRRRDELFLEYARGVQASYLDPRKLEAHLEDVERISAYARRNGCRLIVLLFPILTDPGSPSFQVMKEYFAGAGVELISIDEVVANARLSEHEIIVSRSDPHPSETLHRLLGELVSEKLSAAPAGAEGEGWPLADPPGRLRGAVP